MIHDAWDCSPGKLSLSWLWVFWVFVRLEYQNLVLLVVSVPLKQWLVVRNMNGL